VIKAEQQRVREDWEKRITQYKSSGQGVREWCAANGVKPERLWYWLRRAKAGRTEGEATMWPPVEMGSGCPGEQQASAGLLVRVGKAIIEVKRGFDPELLSTVVRVLSAYVE